MTIFNEMDYRKLLKNFVETQKKSNKSINFQNMATAMRIQKGYLSQFLRGQKDINQDQLYLACQYLKLPTEITSYLQLLLEFDRSIVSSRKKELLRDIQIIQNKNLETGKAIDISVFNENQLDGHNQYYLDPLHQVVHMALFINRYAKKPDLLSRDLMLPKKRIKQLIQSLETMGIIRKEGQGYKILIKNIHLPRDSKLYSPWKNQLTSLGGNRMALLEKEKAYSFTVIFGANDPVRKNIQALFLNFLKEAKTLTNNIDIDDVFQMNFDLFSWTNDS